MIHNLICYREHRSHHYPHLLSFCSFSSSFSSLLQQMQVLHFLPPEQLLSWSPQMDLLRYLLPYCHLHHLWGSQRRLETWPRPIFLTVCPFWIYFWSFWVSPTDQPLLHHRYLSSFSSLAADHLKNIKYIYHTDRWFLTLNMLNCLKDYRRYIHILNLILDLAWPKWMKITLETTIHAVCLTQSMPYLLMLWWL